ncbi:MAG TPA: cold shock domain-containing protein [Gemmatimonadaceae bacterium]|nr:cold shock domain-containing protein [Gemmatimonadaceae bacterium]
MEQGTIVRLMLDKGYGFISSQDGQDVFFRRGVVSDAEFDDLAEGQSVRFTLEDSDRGLRAGSVFAHGGEPAARRDGVAVLTGAEMRSGAGQITARGVRNE